MYGSIKGLLLENLRVHSLPDDFLRLSSQFLHLLVDLELRDGELRVYVELLVELKLFSVPEQDHFEVRFLDKVYVLLYLKDLLVGLEYNLAEHKAVERLSICHDDLQGLEDYLLPDL